MSSYRKDDITRTFQALGKLFMGTDAEAKETATAIVQDAAAQVKARAKGQINPPGVNNPPGVTAQVLPASPKGGSGGKGGK